MLMAFTLQSPNLTKRNNDLEVFFRLEPGNVCYYALVMFVTYSICHRHIALNHVQT